MSYDQRSRQVLDRLSDYSKESLLTAMHRIAGIVGRSSLTIVDIEKHECCSYEMFKQRFGGLNVALSYAAEIIETEEFHPLPGPSGEGNALSG